MNAEGGPPEFVPYGNQRTKSAGRRVDASLKATAKWFREQQAAEARRAAEVRETAEPRGPVGDADLAAATHVYDSKRREWREVVTVNTKTVSVATGYSWTDRVPKARITATRRVDSVHSDSAR